jgi:hypothetical protein
LLTVHELLPEGPGSIAGLEVGDILLECYSQFGRRYIENFYELWDIIDESVGDVIQLTVCRGTEQKLVDLTVQDLLSIIPSRFLEVGGAVIHQLSYQVARLSHLPCKGLYVASAGMFGVPSVILTQLDARNLETLEDLIQTIESIPDGKRVGFRSRVTGAWEEQFHVAEIDHHFFPMSLFEQHHGVWKRKDFTPKPAAEPVENMQTLETELETTWIENLRATLVTIRCRLPYKVHVYPRF